MRTISIIKYSFTGIGLGLLIGTFFTFKSTQNFIHSATLTQGTVIELVPMRKRTYAPVVRKRTYAPVVKFQTESGATVEFTSSTGTNPPSYSEGEIVEVIYQKSDLKSAKINDFFSLWGTTVSLGVLGVVFFLIGFSILLIHILKGKKIQFLKDHGVPIIAKFQSVKRNFSLAVNGVNPYQIYAQWENPSTLKLHIFKSENIWFDPTDYIHTDEITVLIEKDNPKKYFVDISFLPEVVR
jgi:Protein of unknown function (DUF3592)